MSADTEFRLDPSQVEETFTGCLAEDAPDEDSIIVKGIVFDAKFDRSKLEAKAELIGAMLLELPEQFRASGGGGWSFLQACDDRHGNQWTGLHQTMSMLFLMGEGLGLVTNVLPRDVWKALPGGMPYYRIEDADGLRVDQPTHTPER